MNEHRQNALALWAVIMKSPLPETDEEADRENEILDKLCEVLGI